MEINITKDERAFWLGAALTMIAPANVCAFDTVACVFKAVGKDADAGEFSVAVSKRAALDMKQSFGGSQGLGDFRGERGGMNAIGKDAWQRGGSAR